MNTIMFVDDDRLLLSGMRRLLDWQQYGFESPILAAGVQEAQQRFSEIKVDLLVTDIEMPGNNGLELLNWVQRNYPNTAYCLLTGHARFDYAQQAVQLRAFDYLLKPAREEDMIRLLKKYAGLSSKKADSDSDRLKACSSLIRNTIEHIINNLHMPISRESISQDMHVSEGHLSRLFHKEVGESLSEFITNQRMERARELLSNTELSVSEICQQTGYNYQAYFTRIFREHTGMTPLQYRQKERI